MNKRELAEFGENLAKKYLEHNDYQILEKNYHSIYGEIDLICKKDKIYTFIEVKTRKSPKFGTALESITNSKKEKIIKTAKIYLAKNRLEVPVRYDIITIQYLSESNNYSFKHFKNAFFASSLF